MDAGQHDPGMFLWGSIKAWEIQEHYGHNNFKDDPALTGRLVRRMLVHDGEQYIKEELALLTKHEYALANLQANMPEQHNK
jgi:hypothetical protein